MCAGWLNSFDTFMDDMGAKPAGTTLERVENSGDYEPFNCVWATREMQDRNKRSNVRLGDVIASDAARATGLKPNTVLMRLARGDTVERALRG